MIILSPSNTTFRGDKDSPLDSPLKAISIQPEKPYIISAMNKTNKGNRPIPNALIPSKLYVGLLSDWYYGWDGWDGKPIREFGLRSQKGGNFNHDLKRDDSVYVSKNLALARTYASLYARPMVLEVDVAKLDKEKFYYDPLDISDCDDPIQMAYRGIIPAEAIEVKEKQ